jgi:hypothetical protein
LSNLIQQCWNGNPDERPNFQEICTKLRHIKGLLLTEGSSPEGGNLSASRVSKSIQLEDILFIMDQVHIAIPGDLGVELEMRTLLSQDQPANIRALFH